MDMSYDRNNFEARDFQQKIILEHLPLEYVLICTQLCMRNRDRFDIITRKLGHVDLRCAIVNQKVEAGLVVNEKVGSTDNVADINTKAMRGEPYNRRVRHVAKD
eukprot:g7631.t1